MLNEQSISIYVHFPWCIKKCYYCDFNSYQLMLNKSEAEELYLKTLLADLVYSIENILAAYRKTKLISIFFGGGTPSLLSGAAIGKILKQINKYFIFTKDLEITLEVNPGTIEQDSIKNYKLAGINRISLGVQSFQESKLNLLGRIHTIAEVTNTIDQIIKVDFNSFNLDLMYGLPEQNLEDAIYDLNMALSFSPPHFSWYQLTIEPNTLFHAKPPNCPNEETVETIDKAGHKILKEHKYLNYEVSAFAKNNSYYCKHNLNYWQYGDYLGIGPGAHSKLSKFEVKGIPTISAITRLVKIKSPKRYLECTQPDFLVSQQILSKQEIIFEFMLNNLRLKQGFREIDFFNCTGYSFKDINIPLQIAITQNLMEQQGDLIKPTKFGSRFLNDLQALFLG